MLKKFFDPTRTSTAFLKVIIPLVLFVSILQMGIDEFIAVRKAHHDLEVKANLLAENINKMLSQPLWNVDDKKIQQILSSIQADPDVAGTAVFDDVYSHFGSTGILAGKTFEETGSLFREISSPSPWWCFLIHVLHRNEPYSIDQGLVPSKTNLIFKTDSDHHNIGQFYIVLTEKNLSIAFVEELFEDIINAIIITLILIFAVMIIYRKTTSIPLQKMLDVMGSNYNKNEKLQIDWDSNNEIGQAISAFNRMQDREHKYKQELLNSQESLEGEVKERTSKLVNANRQLEKEVAERSRMANILRESEERLSLVIQQSPVAIISWDKKFRVNGWNNTANKIFGYSYTEALGENIEFLFASENEKGIDDIWKDLSNVKTEIHTRKNNITKKGTTITCNWMLAPLSDASGNTVGVLSIVEDISEKLRAEKEREKIKKLESVGVLAGGIAHDFNNILTAIMGNIQLASLDENLTDETKNVLIDANKAGNRAKGLTHQLLTFSKGGNPVLESASLVEVIKESASFVLHGGSVACKEEIPDNLWMVNIDKGQISQVIQNIAINSSQAMPEGGEIVISCENVSDPITEGATEINNARYVLVRITDNGIGISETMLEKIFDPYYTTKKKGSGLGLAICHSIISKHNGLIKVESKVGVGTTFLIYLPASDKRVIEKQVVDVGILEQRGSATIMIMDDDDMILKMTEMMLKKIGFETICASDGEEAVNLYRKSRESGENIDLVITDLTVPGGMGGTDTAQEILTINPDAKIIVASGYSNDPVLANFSKYGFKATLTKPFELNMIKRVIMNVLSS